MVSIMKAFLGVEPLPAAAWELPAASASSPHSRALAGAAPAHAWVSSPCASPSSSPSASPDTSLAAENPASCSSAMTRLAPPQPSSSSSLPRASLSRSGRSSTLAAPPSAGWSEPAPAWPHARMAASRLRRLVGGVGRRGTRASLGQGLTLRARATSSWSPSLSPSSSASTSSGSQGTASAAATWSMRRCCTCGSASAGPTTAAAAAGTGSLTSSSAISPRKDTAPSMPCVVVRTSSEAMCATLAPMTAAHPPPEHGEAGADRDSGTAPVGRLGRGCEAGASRLAERSGASVGISARLAASSALAEAAASASTAAALARALSSASRSSNIEPSAFTTSMSDSSAPPLRSSPPRALPLGERAALPSALLSPSAPASSAASAASASWAPRAAPRRLLAGPFSTSFILRKKRRRPRGQRARSRRRATAPRLVRSPARRRGD
mmetsp:Transcript_8682/g.35418  ORF Transcript_8682/g.35418 Transcript_8682/m.35418 type:complete len:438 (-) Transcript_8682:28-1341(-)